MIFEKILYLLTPKKINLAIKIADNFLIIMVKNPIATGSLQMKNNIFISSKHERAGKHKGFGISNITRVIEKYNGNCQLGVENNYFIMKAIIPVMK